jgi:hypothetical protein
MTAKEINMDLTMSDLDLLLEAVEIWEKESEQREFMGDMMAVALARDEAQWERLQAKRDEVALAREQENRRRKERGVLLRAKLITLRDRLGAAELTQTFSDQLREQARCQDHEEPQP